MMKINVAIMSMVMAGSAMAQLAPLTEVTLQNGATVQVEISAMTVNLPPQCEPKFCDSDDVNCDGILETTCTGLTYDVCAEDGVTQAYMDAAFTGFCIEADTLPAEVPTEENCEGVLVISPGFGGDRITCE